MSSLINFATSFSETCFQLVSFCWVNMVRGAVWWLPEWEPLPWITSLELSNLLLMSLILVIKKLLNLVQSSNLSSCSDRLGFPLVFCKWGINRNICPLVTWEFSNFTFVVLGFGCFNHILKFLLFWNIHIMIQCEFFLWSFFHFLFCP